MDTKDIVISVLAIVLVFVLGIVFVKRKTGNPTEHLSDQVSPGAIKVVLSD